MAYTFGAAATNDISQGINLSWGASNRPWLLMGWWYPTTLTAGRAYFGSSTNTALLVGSTTSEFQVVFDRVTTDAVFDTSGAGIAVGNWWFIAAWGTQNTSDGTESVRLWVGTIDSPPQKVTTTKTTSGVGGLSGSTSVGIGNKGSTGNVSFQGDIESVFFLNTYTPTSGGYEPFGLADSSALDDDAEYVTFWRWIAPYWSGVLMTADQLLHRVTTEYQEGLYFPLYGSGPLAYRMSAAATVSGTQLTPTIGGSVPSAGRAPRAYPDPIYSRYSRR